MRVTSIYDYGECDEVADSIRRTPGFMPFDTFDAAHRYVRTVMGDQGDQIIDNVAEGQAPTAS
jgi:hypothetical protein